MLNSVVQYFPDEAYLRSVLDTAVRRLTTQGVLFVGDVRSLPLLDAFHASVLAGRSTTEPGALLDRAALPAADEEELALHPLWFDRWSAAAAPSAAVQLEPRRGEQVNELTLFRYDAVVLRREENPGPATGIRWHPWSDGWSEPDLARELARPGRPPFGLTGVPYGPLREELERRQALAWAGGRDVLLLARSTALPLSGLRELAARGGRRLLTSLRRGGTDGGFDAVFLPAGQVRSPGSADRGRSRSPDSWRAILAGPPGTASWSRRSTGTWRTGSRRICGPPP